ncbi:Uncharacterized protein OBRU01_19431, partial [Operophtera brumata]
DRPLAHNATARVFHSNQSLVLQKVTRQSSGRYACSALNAEGETVSNELHFRVKYSPSCRAGGVSVVGAARGESVVIVCEVDADPPAAVFKWKFNNSGETIDVAADRYTSNGSASSLKYTPVADLDYGTLSCSASNEVGTQLAPCVFQMVAAVSRSVMRGELRRRPATAVPIARLLCRRHLTSVSALWNQAAESVELSCVASFDGGLPQQLLLLVYSADDTSPRYYCSCTPPMTPHLGERFVEPNCGVSRSVMRGELRRRPATAVPIARVLRRRHLTSVSALWNQTAESVEVSCVASFDGGLPQQFLLLVYSADDTSPR